jgi:hypothetical protein
MIVMDSSANWILFWNSLLSIVATRINKMGTVKVGVPKKVVFTKISPHVSVSNKSIF